VKTVLAYLSYLSKSLGTLVSGELVWAQANLHHGFGAVSFDGWMAQATLLAGTLVVYKVTNGPKPVVADVPVAK
jgi:hypothetical protein